MQSKIFDRVYASAFLTWVQPGTPWRHCNCPCSNSTLQHGPDKRRPLSSPPWSPLSESARWPMSSPVDRQDIYKWWWPVKETVGAITVVSLQSSTRFPVHNCFLQLKYKSNHVTQTSSRSVSHSRPTISMSLWHVGHVFTSNYLIYLMIYGRLPTQTITFQNAFFGSCIPIYWFYTKNWHMGSLWGDPNMIPCRDRGWVAGKLLVVAYRVFPAGDLDGTHLKRVLWIE